MKSSPILPSYLNPATVILLSLSFKHAEQILVVEGWTETTLKSLLNIFKIQLFNSM